MSTRQAAKGVHAHAGVVGQRGQASVLRGKRALVSAFSTKVRKGSSASPRPGRPGAPVPRPAGKHGLQLGSLPWLLDANTSFMVKSGSGAY